MRTCELEGCTRKHIAKGLCQYHYVKAQRLARGREVTATITVPCACCGEMVQRTATQAKRYRPTCSDACKYELTYGYRKGEKPGLHGRELVGPIRTPRPRAAPSYTIRATKRRFISGSCAHCATPFVHDLRVTGVISKFCTQKCSRASHKVTRERKRGRFAIAPTERLAIYERDEWTCQLCMDPVDPDLPPHHRWAATLDHIECQSWALIPDHSASNLRLAHRMCNSMRGDRAT